MASLVTEVMVQVIHQLLVSVKQLEDLTVHLMIKELMVHLMDD